MVNCYCDESVDKRPDATISKIQERDCGQSLGFGEVKLARLTTDNHALCHDLLRLGTFCKVTMDMNKLQAALAFHINGLQHHLLFNAYDMMDLVDFLSLKNICTLLRALPTELLKPNFATRFSKIVLLAALLKLMRNLGVAKLGTENCNS
ncbi:hypothetical protein BDA99DRAFT_534403 [Phascolomyces articulosus]|uniref:Uncharacterized protein n=1 Tax=Phascolomyces articulosus TaxID=60185 RepID=A0AAD5PGZ6_9FUNG|nr:hypothetical protein BDA99DRAFT_534403 [Phascolomyces articulosus]